MRRRGFILVVGLIVLSLALSGCGYMSAQTRIGEAESSLAALKNAGGMEKTTYQYCSAESYLEIAKMEFNDNQFGWAKRFADRSKAASSAGLSEIKK